MTDIETIGLFIAMICGAGGLAISILAYMNQRDATKPRIRVRPRVMRSADPHVGVKSGTEGRPVAVIEVSNVGQTPVIGNTVGFKQKRKYKGDIWFRHTTALTGEQWPSMIHPGHMILLTIDLSEVQGAVKEGRISRAFMQSRVGDLFLCSRGDMSEFIRSCKDLDASEPNR